MNKRWWSRVLFWFWFWLGFGLPFGRRLINLIQLIHWINLHLVGCPHDCGRVVIVRDCGFMLRVWNVRLTRVPPNILVVQRIAVTLCSQNANGETMRASSASTRRHAAYETASKCDLW